MQPDLLPPCEVESLGESLVFVGRNESRSGWLRELVGWFNLVSPRNPLGCNSHVHEFAWRVGTIAAFTQRHIDCAIADPYEDGSVGRTNLSHRHEVIDSIGSMNCPKYG